ncbi:MAG TPA: NAD(+) diphosphatase [Trebonia sp.]|jgi:NAD+ diphosphatase
MSVPAEIDGFDAGPLGRLALSRSAVDRATQRRADAEWIEAAWAAPGTRVVVVHNSQVLATTSGGRPELAFIAPAEAPEGTRFFLGIDDDEVAYFGVSAAAEAEPWSWSPRPDAEPISLRLAGALLSDRDAGLLTHAVALANWHDTHTHCPKCGAETVPAPAGHITVCPVDGTEHFPRLDPAVIMLVTDPDDRCLLARNALWPKGRMSVLAGFVEPGESAEHAVVREVFEESAIVVGQVRYLGSQPWPMPRSLMLGYQAVAAAGQSIAVDEDEIGEARWFTRAEMKAAIDAGELGIAPSSSIARRLIEYWYGTELPDGSAGWTAAAR